MAMKKWNPQTKVSRGNITIAVTESIIDINAPKLAEINASMKLDCSMTEFSASSSSDSESIDWLYSATSEQLPSSTKYEIDELTIKSTGQDDDEIIQALRIGDPIYLWRRDGVPNSNEPEAGQKVWVWKAVITTIDPLEAGNTYIGIKCGINVSDRSEKAVAIVA